MKKLHNLFHWLHVMTKSIKYEEKASLKRREASRLRWSVWVCAVFMSSIAYGDVTVTLSDDPRSGDPDAGFPEPMPQVELTSSGSTCVPQAGFLSEDDYRQLQNPKDVTGFYAREMVYFAAPDRSPVSAHSNPIIISHGPGDGNIGKDISLLCPSGSLERNDSGVYSLSVEPGASCNLSLYTRDGTVNVTGTVTLKADTVSPTAADYYYHFSGKCGGIIEPALLHITRQSPSTPEVNQESLTWLVQFTEDVSDVDANDFVVTGATGMTLNVVKAQNHGDFGYEVTASGGDFSTSGNPAYLKLAANNDIKEVNGSQQALATKDNYPLTNDNYYCYGSCTSRTTINKNTKVETSKGILTSLKEEDSNTFTTGKPDNMNFDLGTYSYKVENLTAGDTVTITLTLKSDVPTDAKIYKVSSSGYTELGSSNNLVINGKTIKFDITDGGALDADGDATNGVIVDPVAIGTSVSTTTTTTTTSGGSGNFGIMGVLLGSALFGLAAYRRRARTS